TYCSYIMASQAKEISLLDSFACSWSPSLIMSIMSRRCLVGDDARHSWWRRLSCSYAVCVACGVGGMMEKCRAVVSIYCCRRALRGCGTGGCTVHLGNTWCTVRPDKGCLSRRVGRARLVPLH